MENTHKIYIFLGCLVLIHGTVLHRSFPNKSNKSRHAYTFHIVEQENTEYSKQNWWEFMKILNVLIVLLFIEAAEAFKHNAK